MIKEAKQEGIKVLAYDRMINNADIDFYISFDNEKWAKCRPKVWWLKLLREITF